MHAVAQVYLWQTMLCREAGSDLHNTILWRSTVWFSFPLFPFPRQS